MITLVYLYSTTTLAFVISLLLLWTSQTLSIGKMILLLFLYDLSLTVEAGFNSDVLLIAMLHAVTIPVFFGLIYIDVLKESKSNSSCFVCGKAIAGTDSVQGLKRSVNGRQKTVFVHDFCIDIENKDRKIFHTRRFRSGIPR